MEHDHLIIADRHIAEGEKIVAAQQLIVEQIRPNGGDLTTALATLDAFVNTLKSFYSHRQHILRAIARLQE